MMEEVWLFFMCIFIFIELSVFLLCYVVIITKVIIANFFSLFSRSSMILNQLQFLFMCENLGPRRDFYVSHKTIQKGSQNVNFLMSISKENENNKNKGNQLLWYFASVHTFPTTFLIQSVPTFS